ncbi:alpha/beta fold hydrolase [Corynebacterium crudilactis]|uniref:Lysophospholipase n=1 Tax=Corynebacterium crudilactis TaxID=1652495 RepID=A0A172QU86_9CORY|nr:alpha/beta hydrolase [Corynebacterium crudilactis]ANE04275.1 lysophospholipase [Corynebacterium crudilactis]
MDQKPQPSAAHSWKPDFLGEGFEHHTIELGNDPDNETDVVATVIRYNPDAGKGGSADIAFASRPALLWVHGMTDYFFHTEFAEFFHNAGFAVYAVDLRKCGRSYRPGQRWHYISDLAYYFPDLSAATALITKQHPELIPVAHSTGGLIVPLWMSAMRQTNPTAIQKISALVLNSPWLDMMYPPLFMKLITPIVKVVGKLRPTTLIPGGGLGSYGKSIHKDFYGEWEFDQDMKPVEGHRKTIGWLRAILAGQDAIHRDQVDVGVDILTLHSSSSWLKSEYSEATNSSDAVLDIEQIQQWAPHLNASPATVFVKAIPGARHDIFLSQKPVRDHALHVMNEWLAPRISSLKNLL